MLNMQAFNNLVRAEVLDHIDPDACTAEDRLKVELEVLEAIRKKTEEKIELQRSTLIAEGLAFYAEHLRESAPGKSWWQEHAPEQWASVCRLSKVRLFKLR